MKSTGMTALPTSHQTSASAPRHLFDALLTVSGVNNIHAHNATSGDASIALSTSEHLQISNAGRYTLYLYDDGSDGDNFIINDSTASQRRLADAYGSSAMSASAPRCLIRAHALT